MRPRGKDRMTLILPFFTREIVQKGGNIKMTDVNAWSLREINPTRSTRIHLNTTRLPIVPMMQDYAETDLCIYGTNIDSPEYLFFIYDKNKQKVKDIRYWDEKQLKSKYPDTHIPFLFTGNLLLHPERGICRTMNNLNSLFFFDLQGELLKEVVIGTERIWPEADPQFLDFPQANNMSFHLQGIKNAFISSTTVTRQILKAHVPSFCDLTGRQSFKIHTDRPRFKPDCPNA